MFALDCPTQGYDWGSLDAIPDFLRNAGTGTPIAEVWMGTHPLGTATADAPDGPTALTEISGELPFMMKLLAAARPLSIQVHPTRALAQQGFAAEEASGVPLSAPERVFKDPHPKPEMVYALTTFDSLVGFRPTAEILRVLASIDHPLTRSLGDDLRRNPGFKGIVRLVERLVTEPPAAEEVDAIVEQCRAAAAQGIDIKRAYTTAAEIAEHHPSDLGVVVSLLLNRLTLQPGEAAFLDAGIIHAHLSGLCLEVMVSSDNVIRAGLTSKHIDGPGLITCLDRGMSRLARVTPHQFGFSTDVFTPGAGDFALSVTQCSQAEPVGVVLPERGQRILMCTGGEVALVNEHSDSLWLRRGEVAYADEKDGELRVVGTGEVAQAFVPAAPPSSSDMRDIV